jgi:hypothetical protein
MFSKQGVMRFLAIIWASVQRVKGATFSSFYQNAVGLSFQSTCFVLCHVLEFMMAPLSRLPACELCLRTCMLFPFSFFPTPLSFFSGLWGSCKLGLGDYIPRLPWNLSKFRLVCLFQNLCFSLVGAWVVM